MHTRRYTRTHTEIHTDTHTRTHRHVHIHTHSHTLCKHTEVKMMTHVFPRPDHLQEAWQLVITGSCRTPTRLPFLPPLGPGKVCFPHRQVGMVAVAGTDRRSAPTENRSEAAALAKAGPSGPAPPGQVSSSLPGRIPGQSPARSCVTRARAGREAGRESCHCRSTWVPAGNQTPIWCWGVTRLQGASQLYCLSFQS